MTTENAPDPAAPDTIVLVHGFWVTPRSWEKWVERYEGKGYHVLTPTYPGFEVEVEALREDPLPDRGADLPRHHRAHRGYHRRTRQAADYHRTLGGRRAHPDPARPRLRGSWCGHRLGAPRGRMGHPGLADQVALPDPEEPRQPSQGSRVHPRAVPLRLRQHPLAGGVRRGLRALPHPRL